MLIKGKTAVITGAAKGIGRACAIQLAKDGANVVIVDTDEENGKITEKSINKENVIFMKADVTKEREIREVCSKVLSKFDSIDILINNAAKQTEKPFFDMTVTEFRRVIDVNLTGTFICSNIIGNKMKKNGKIINMLSVHYDKPRKYKYHYDASKAGIAMLTKEMALELIERQITVNAISYGACNTDMNKNWLNDSQKVHQTLSKIPLKWIAEPEEIADFTINVLKNFSDYTTGSIFSIDGGRSLV